MGLEKKRCSATHCSALQHLQQCDPLQHTREKAKDARDNMVQQTATHCNILQHDETHLWERKRPTATHYERTKNRMQHPATRVEIVLTVIGRPKSVTSPCTQIFAMNLKNRYKITFTRSVWRNKHHYRMAVRARKVYLHHVAIFIVIHVQLCESTFAGLFFVCQLFFLCTRTLLIFAVWDTLIFGALLGSPWGYQREPQSEATVSVRAFVIL